MIHLNFLSTFHPYYSIQKYLFLVLAYGIGLSSVFAQTITTVAGNGTPGFSGDRGPALSAMLSDIDGMATDNIGNLFIVDSVNQRIRRVDSVTQIITTAAGNGIIGFAGDGGPAVLAQFNDIDGVEVDAQSNLFIADTGNNRIREVDGATGIIKTVAGNGGSVFSGDGGPANLASLRYPSGVSVDPQGNIFIADTFNNRVRRVDKATGIIKTVAGIGTYGYSGDGGSALLGELHFPLGVAVDAWGNIFIADTSSHRIRRVDKASGTITTIAGNGVQGYGGDGGSAQTANLNSPGGVIVDAAGNLFIADTGNHRIREVDGFSGLIKTVAGTGTAFYSGDGGPATLAELNSPTSVGKDGNGNLYIADDNNNVVRKIAALLAVATLTPLPVPSLTPTPTPAFTMAATPSPSTTLTPMDTLTPTSTSTPICEPHVWPDPFSPAAATGGVLKVSCVPLGGTVSFFTLSGELVRRIQEVGQMALWDGQNRNGILVSTGVYFYVIQQGAKVIQTGKLIVKNPRG